MSTPQPLHIVVVDDSSMIRRMLRVAIDTYDGTELVAEATDGVEGVEACREHRPDAVILDVEMPNMNGLDAIAPIRSAAPEVKIAMFSSDDRVAPVAIAAGADAFYLKGDASPYEVLSGLAETCGRR